jgi:hypothetical protein
MALTTSQVSGNSRNVANELTRQDKKLPFYINVEDGRLVPNVQNVRKMPNYRPYHGDPNADTATRLASLEGHSRTTGTRVVASRPILDMATFDVATAKKAELLAFAADEYPDLELDASQHPMTLRKLILAAGERAAAAAGASTEDMT